MLRALHKVHSEKHKGCFAMNTEKENYYFLRKVSTRRIINTRHSVACIAGVSARVCRESWQESKKKKEWGGRGKGVKETLAHKPHNFEKLHSPMNVAFDWCGAGSVD